MTGPLWFQGQVKGAPMLWYEDPVFRTAPFPDDPRTPEAEGRPAFRFTLHSHTRDGHPFEYGAIYDEIFALFEPILRRDVTHVAMFTSKGTTPKRKAADKAGEWWRPFAFMREEFLGGADPKSDYSTWHWNGFDFLSGLEDAKAHKNSHRYLGPTKFCANFFRSIKIDATIPVADFEAGALDVKRLTELVTSLPVATANMGFGISGFDSLIGASSSGYWLEIARRYPALDICTMRDRDQWWLEHKGDFTKYWLDGVTWITFVGRHFLDPLGGSAALTNGLDPAIAVTETENGLLFQLGARPITGEAGADDALLPLYIALAARLRPLGNGCPSAENNWQRPFTDDPDSALNVEWARRFYDRENYSGNQGGTR